MTVENRLLKLTSRQPIFNNLQTKTLQWCATYFQQLTAYSGGASQNQMCSVFGQLLSNERKFGGFQTAYCFQITTFSGPKGPALRQLTSKFLRKVPCHRPPPASPGQTQSWTLRKKRQKPAKSKRASLRVK